MIRLSDVRTDSVYHNMPFVTPFPIASMEVMKTKRFVRNVSQIYFVTKNNFNLIN